jgi:hypothetical protein
MSANLLRLGVRVLAVGMVVWLALGFPAALRAEVVISELLPAPTDSSQPHGEQEWVELYNTSDAAVDLEGWILEDSLSQPSTIAQLSGELAGTSFLVIPLDSTVLNNNGDTVILRDSSSVARDQLQYSSSSPGMSWSRTALEASAEITETTPSPGTATLLPSPTPSPSPSPSPSPALSLRSSNFTWKELHPCPDSADEKLIIQYTGSETASVELTLQDDSSNTISQTVQLSPQSDIQLQWSQSLLNNSGDSITLLHRGEALLSTNSPACDRGEHFTWQIGTWVSSQAPLSPSPSTASSPDPSPSPAPSPSPTSDQAATTAQTTSSPSPYDPTYLNRLTLSPAASDDPGSASTASESSTEPISTAQPPQSPQPPNLALLRRGVVSAILGGTLLTMSSSYGLYVWTETTLYPALQSALP